VVQGPPANVQARPLGNASGTAAEAVIADHSLYADGAQHTARIYDRAKLAPGHVIAGPAVVTEMDATTLILPGHRAEVDPVGNLLIRPET
jgi:N-methylhydantoinase A